MEAAGVWKPEYTELVRGFTYIKNKNNFYRHFSRSYKTQRSTALIFL